MTRAKLTSKQQKALAVGLHVVEQVLTMRPDVILCMYVDQQRSDQRIGRLVATAKQRGIAVQEVKSPFLDKLAMGANHQGVAIECQNLSFWKESDLSSIINASAQPFLLVLDGVQDPHNLGACLRTAYGMGVDAVIIPQRRSCGLTPVVHKVSCGASILTPLISVVNLARTLKILAKAGIWIVGLDANANKSIYDLDLKMPIALLMGSEGQGARRLSLAHCDHLARIPMCSEIDSLNVSVASGMAMYEVNRQRID